MKIFERKLNNIEGIIEISRKEVLRLEKVVKESMQELNDSIQNTDLKSIEVNGYRTNWNYAEKFAKIQSALMQLENEKGQLAALENLFQ